jgi:hypothetical protein
MSKGGPRVSLFESCKKLQWSMPTFESMKVEPRYYYFTLGCLALYSLCFLIVVIRTRILVQK